MYVEWNPSPSGAKVGDCAVRAVAKALGTDWQTAYAMLCIRGMELYDMPNSNAVINAVLTDNGFDRKAWYMPTPNPYREPLPLPAQNSRLLLPRTERDSTRKTFQAPPFLKYYKTKNGQAQ